MSFWPSFVTSSSRRPWLRELLFSGFALLFGFAILPVLIFQTGAALLGRYEGASLGRLFESLYSGLATGSVAAWIVLFGPYGLYLIFRGLALWWRAGTKKG